MSSYPINYELQNDASTKYLNIVVEFEGTSTRFSLLPTYRKVEWGTPGIVYGQDGLLWGGILVDTTIKPIISPNTQLVIDQKIEPEQGRGSAATMNLEFVDLDGFMSEFVTPGIYLDEILGGKLVKIYMGYQNTNFKEDYFVIFRGYVSMITAAPTKVILQLTDANLKRRQQIFKLGKTQLRQVNQGFQFTDVNFVGNTITLPAHEFQNGNIVQLFTGGSLPAGISPATNYYIVNRTPTTIQLSLTLSGPVISLLSQGSGASSIYLYGIGPLTAYIPVIASSDFVQPVLGPDGLYDSSIGTYAKIDNEIMSYSPSGLASESITVLRAQRDTIAADHSTTGQTAVDNICELVGNIIDLSLKLMLSGWGGVWKSNIVIKKFVQTSDPNYGDISTALILPNTIDAIDEYGLSPGDYIYITGATNPLNNGQRIITGFLDLAGTPNNIILVDSPFVIEVSTAAIFSTRSQYDTLPVSCGSKLNPTDIDVQSWQQVKSQYLGQPINTFRIYVTSPQSGKEFIESQFLLPAGAYSVTRFGRLSLTLTKPPLAGENLVVIDTKNVIDPQTITVTRGLNNRRFFNQVQYTFDYDDSGNSTNKVVRFDSESISTTDTTSVLPISAQGLRTENGAQDFINKRLNFLLSRYKSAAIEIKVKVNWRAASLIEVSDIVALYDNGTLKITNLETGERNMGEVLLEVIQRTIDIKTGVGSLTLLNQTGYLISDRFAGIAPSSLVGIGSNTTEVVIKDSFGVRYPFNEKKKWEAIVGDKIRIHSRDYAYDHTVVFLGFQIGSSYRMLISPALPSAPLPDYVVDCWNYPDTTNKADQSKSKLLFSFINPTYVVVSGISTTQFTVSPADALGIFPNLPVKINSADFSQESEEAIVDNVTGVVVTLKTAIAFIPSPGQFVNLIGFRDGLGPYRVL